MGHGAEGPGPAAAGGRTCKKRDLREGGFIKLKTGRSAVTELGAADLAYADREAIADLKHRVDIVDIVGRHATLKRGLGALAACCPLHGEKSASFKVNPATQ